MRTIRCMTPFNVVWLRDVRLREHKTFALRLRYRVAEFLRRINPQLNCFIDVLQRGFLTVAMCHNIRAVLALRQ